MKGKGREGRGAGSGRFCAGREAVLLVGPTTVHKKSIVSLSLFINICPCEVLSEILFWIIILDVIQNWRGQLINKNEAQ